MDSPAALVEVMIKLSEWDEPKDEENLQPQLVLYLHTRLSLQPFITVTSYSHNALVQLYGRLELYHYSLLLSRFALLRASWVLQIVKTSDSRVSRGIIVNHGWSPIEPETPLRLDPFVPTNLVSTHRPTNSLCSRHAVVPSLPSSVSLPTIRYSDRRWTS